MPPQNRRYSDHSATPQYCTEQGNPYTIENQSINYSTNNSNNYNNNNTRTVVSNYGKSSYNKPTYNTNPFEEEFPSQEFDNNVEKVIDDFLNDEQVKKERKKREMNRERKEKEVSKDVDKNCNVDDDDDDQYQDEIADKKPLETKRSYLDYHSLVAMKKERDKKHSSVDSYTSGSSLDYNNTRRFSETSLHHRVLSGFKENEENKKMSIGSSQRENGIMNKLTKKLNNWKDNIKAKSVKRNVEKEKIKSKKRRERVLRRKRTLGY